MRYQTALRSDLGNRANLAAQAFYCNKGSHDFDGNLLWIAVQFGPDFLEFGHHGTQLGPRAR